MDVTQRTSNTFFSVEGKAKILNCKDLEKAELQQALASRSYHLPKYGCLADLYQYITNNHPLLGICCHHRDHPIQKGMRMVALVGSILVGLTISNVYFMTVLTDDSNRWKQPMITMKRNSSAVLADSSQAQQYTASFENEDGDWQLTNGMLLLSTVGGALHSAFDLAIWYLHACSFSFPYCCHESVSNSIVISIIILVATIASFAMMLRASIEEGYAATNDDGLYENNENGFETYAYDDAALSDGVSLNQMDYAMAYLAEFVLAMLVWNPIMSIVLFSGILGCHRLPVLGGRPRQMRILAQEKD